MQGVQAKANAIPMTGGAQAPSTRRPARANRFSPETAIGEGHPGGHGHQDRPEQHDRGCPTRPRGSAGGCRRAGRSHEGGGAEDGEHHREPGDEGEDPPQQAAPLVTTQLRRVGAGGDRGRRAGRHRLHPREPGPPSRAARHPPWRDGPRPPGTVPGWAPPAAPTARSPTARRPSRGTPAPGAGRTARGTRGSPRRRRSGGPADRRGSPPVRPGPSLTIWLRPGPGRPRPSSGPARGSRPRASSPSTFSALAGSPTSRSTSAGRRKRSSMTTCFSQSRPTAAKASSHDSPTEWVSPVATT